ncbi:MAG: Na-translocating system protein MpsC family protein [Cyanobacteria bacterium P01_A01_bin.84]
MYHSNFVAAKTEEILSQNLQSLFLNQLSHEPEEINCDFFTDRLVITIKNVLTKPEQLLICHGYTETAKKIRNSIEEILKPQLKIIIEEFVDVQTTQILFATYLDSNYMSLIVFFDKDLDTTI